MNKCEEIADAYRKVTMAGAWYGPSVAELLARILPEQAVTKPVAFPWNELVERWNKSRDLLEERVRHFPVGDLEKQTPGRTYPYELLLNGIVQHTIWHAGQIAMVHSMVKGK